MQSPNQMNQMNQMGQMGQTDQTDQTGQMDSMPDMAGADQMTGFQSVNHKWRKRCRLAKRAETRQNKRFWQNCLLDPDCAFGLRKARTGIRHTVS